MMEVGRELLLSCQVIAVPCLHKWQEGPHQHHLSSPITGHGDKLSTCWLFHNSL